MLDLRQDVLELVKNEQKYLSSVTPSLSLSAPNVQTVEDDEEEFIEEFYPEARKVKGKKGETVQKKEESIENEKRKSEKNNSGENTEEKGNSTPGIPEKEIKAEIKEKEEKVKESSHEKSSEIDFSDAHFLNKKGAYANLYNRMITAMQEGNKEESGKLANRLTKEFLKIFFEKEHPEIVFKEDKKSLYLEEMDKLLAMDGSPLDEEETLEFSIQEEQEESEPVKGHPFIEKIIELADQKSVADAMTEYFKPVPINRTLDKEGLIKTARKLIEQGQGQEQGQDKEEIREQEPSQEQKQKQTPENATPADSAPADQKEALSFSERKFDTESGPVEKDQLRTMVQLKNELVNLKLIDPLKWYNFVGQFLDAEGNPLGTAKNMSKKQADCLITMLDKKLEGYSKEIPF